MSRLDIDAMFAELADDVACCFPTAPEGGPREIRGRDTNRGFFSGVIRPMLATYAVTRMNVHLLGDDAEQIVADYASEGSLIDGSPYHNTYLALGMVRGGKIERWTEFCDPAPILRGIAALQAGTR